ncbi:hypothetical protein LPJ75_006624, partial [Coemansia sp. RSA 2598]
MIYPDDVVLDDDDYRDQFQPAQDLYSATVPTLIQTNTQIPVVYQTTIRQTFAGMTTTDPCIPTTTTSLSVTTRNDHYNVDDHPDVYHNDDNNLGRNVYDHGDNNCVWHADHNCCDHHDNNDNDNYNCNVYNSDKPDYCNCYRDNHQYHAYCVDQLVYHCSAPGDPNYNHCHVYASADYNIGFHSP